ncbi:LysR family transcriptional regulator [Ligilactobacillus equi]|uniref:LysR family transcriptional regulator n=1 Tax=Ligilactobacillus equi DPC 6820 TaxID=1392007 RepID=V7HYG4_9LACO|nr:LysR family transcriptional regulator [Ligilactobacillus equi]ETA74263.1 LysR family transcriptional regulator [Ligilactobacillus equi DPC 6820]
MHIEHLTTFINLAETLNFSKTAENMHLSQSAVSQIIASIEKQLEITLFYRSRKGVTLAPAGADLYQSLKPWMNGYYKAIQHAQQVASQEKKQLTIGYSGTPYENSVLPQLVREFSQSNPNIKVFLENYSHHELMDHLQRGLCDLIFTMPDIIAGNDNFAYTELMSGYYCVIVPKNYGFNPTEKMVLQDLDHQSLIFLDHRWCPPSQDKLQKEITQVCHQLDLSYVNNIATAYAMVKAGQGLGIWANFVSDPNEPHLQKITLVTDITPSYGLATLKHANNHTINNFSKWLLEKV